MVGQSVAVGVAAEGAVQGDGAGVDGLRFARVGGGPSVGDGYGGAISAEQAKGVGDGEAEAQFAGNEGYGEGRAYGVGSAEDDVGTAGLFPVVGQGVAVGVTAEGAVEGDGAGVHGLRFARVGGGRVVGDGDDGGISG